MTQIYTGLYDLAREGKISLDVTSRFDDRIKKSRRNSVLCVQVTDSGSNRMRTVCFDMFDGREITSRERLELCDVYFKRSYDDHYVGELDARQRGKMFPYGLNFECRTRNERDILKRLFIFHLANNTAARNPVRFLKHVVTELLAHLCLRLGFRASRFVPMSSGDFVVRPEEPAEPRVLFQTRLWTPEECRRISEDRLGELNQMRVDTVRALGKRFGQNFAGGLVPTDLTRQRYPDLCLSDEESQRSHYLRMVRKCLVCVTTAGLLDSTGFKFPEYLAASRCIVAEPPSYRLPVPVLEGTHYLSFRTAEQCADACERLLADPQLADRMRRANYSYYLNEVEPAVLIYKRLTAALSVPQAASSSTSTGWTPAT